VTGPADPAGPAGAGPAGAGPAGSAGAAGPAGPAGSAGPGPGPSAAGAGRSADRDQLALLRLLLVLTLVSGLIDAVCYLGLGRVFTANMTGNVVVLGFAAAGAPGFSVTGSLISLGVFLAGAVAAGRAARRIASRRRLLLAALIAEAVLVGAAALVASQASTAAAGWARYAVIAILALGMGVRNAAVRHLAVPDMTTTVLTQTLTGLAADSGLAGGTNPRAGRRSAAVLAMLAGAITGAALFLHLHAALPLAVAAALTAVAGTVLLLSRRSLNLDAARPGSVRRTDAQARG
jgi:uncharacterized membrane protein YoaK (UPF0700 family)